MGRGPVVRTKTSIDREQELCVADRSHRVRWDVSHGISDLWTQNFIDWGLRSMRAHAYSRRSRGGFARRPGGYVSRAARACFARIAFRPFLPCAKFFAVTRHAVDGE